MNANNSHRPPEKRKSGAARKPKHNSSGAKITVFIVLAVILVALLLIVVSFMKYKPNTDDAKLPFETLPNGAEVVIGSSANGDGDENEPSKPVVSEDSVNGYTRTKTDQYNFLILGKDRAALNTDVIMLVSFNTKTGEIAIMQIPRDTMIWIFGDTHRLNSMYAIYYTDALSSGATAKEAMEQGMEDFVSVLQTNLNLKIDYWALCDLDGFVEIIDIIGGVEMDVPFDMNYEDPYQDLYIHIKAGKQVLSGEQSEQFVRFRSEYSQADVGRIDAQKLFLAALMDQLKSSLKISMIPSLASSVIENVNTNLSAADIVYFGKEALGADLSSLEMMTIPGEAAREYGDSGRWLYFIKRADTLSLINMYYNVYDRDISDSIFDIKGVFNISSRSHINAIYNSTPSEDLVADYITSGKQANEEGIYIPLN